MSENEEIIGSIEITSISENNKDYALGTIDWMRKCLDKTENTIKKGEYSRHDWYDLYQLTRLVTDLNCQIERLRFLEVLEIQSKGIKGYEYPQNDSDACIYPTDSVDSIDDEPTCDT